MPRATSVITTVTHAAGIGFGSATQYGSRKCAASAAGSSGISTSKRWSRAGPSASWKRRTRFLRAEGLRAGAVARDDAQPAHGVAARGRARGEELAAPVAAQPLGPGGRRDRRRRARRAAPSARASLPAPRVRRRRGPVEAADAAGPAGIAGSPRRATSFCVAGRRQRREHRAEAARCRSRTRAGTGAAATPSQRVTLAGRLDTRATRSGVTSTPVRGLAVGVARPGDPRPARPCAASRAPSSPTQTSSAGRAADGTRSSATRWPSTSARASAAAAPRRSGARLAARRGAATAFAVARLSSAAVGGRRRAVSGSAGDGPCAEAEHRRRPASAAAAHALRIARQLHDSRERRRRSALHRSSSRRDQDP